MKPEHQSFLQLAILVAVLITFAFLNNERKPRDKKRGEPESWGRE